MKKLLGTLALAPLAITACGSTTAPNNNNGNGDVQKTNYEAELKTKLDAADARIASGLNGTTKNIATAANTDAITSCTIDGKYAMNGAALINTSTKSAGKLTYTYSSGFTSDFFGETFTMPAQTSYSDEVNNVIYMLVTQEVYDSEMTNPIMEDGSRIMPAESIGKYFKSAFMNDAETMDGIDMSCAGFVKETKESINMIKDQAPGGVVFDKVEKDSSYEYTFTQSEDGSDFSVLVAFDKTSDLPTTIRFNAEMNGVTMFKVEMNVSDYNSTTVTLPTGTDVFDPAA